MNGKCFNFQIGAQCTCNPKQQKTGHIQLTILECRAILPEVRRSGNPRHGDLVSEMKQFDVAFEIFCGRWQVNDKSLEVLHKVGLWEAKKVIASFNSKAKTPKDWNTNLQAYVIKAIKNSNSAE